MDVVQTHQCPKPSVYTNNYEKVYGEIGDKFGVGHSRNFGKTEQIAFDARIYGIV